MKVKILDILFIAAAAFASGGLLTLVLDGQAVTFWLYSRGATAEGYGIFKLIAPVVVALFFAHKAACFLLRGQKGLF